VTLALRDKLNTQQISTVWSEHMRKPMWVFLLLVTVTFPRAPLQAAKDKTPPIPSCPAKFNDSLETNGIADDFQHGVTAPRATKAPEAKLTDEARSVAHDEIATRHIKLWEAISVVSLIVEQDGTPGSMCVQRSAGYGLDAQALKAAAQYRFYPATANGQPVRARLSISISFKVY
jgi:TonB family protein